VNTSEKGIIRVEKGKKEKLVPALRKMKKKMSEA